MAMRRPSLPNRDAILYVSGLHEEIQENNLKEIFSEFGIVNNVHMPKDSVTKLHKGFGFIEFQKKYDAEKAFGMMNLSEIKGRTVVVNTAVEQYNSSDIGANLFVGNLDCEITEMSLYMKFSEFGVMLKPPTCVRSPLTGGSKGFAFIHYSTFEAADAAIAAMDGQHFGRRRIMLSYSFKHKLSKEPHGCEVERSAADQKTKPKSPPIDIAAPNTPETRLQSPPTTVDVPPQTRVLMSIASVKSSVSDNGSPVLSFLDTQSPVLSFVDTESPVLSFLDTESSVSGIKSSVSVIKSSVSSIKSSVSGIKSPVLTVLSTDSTVSPVFDTESPVNYYPPMHYHPGPIYSMSPPSFPQKPVEMCRYCGWIAQNNLPPYAGYPFPPYYPYVPHPYVQMSTSPPDEIVYYE